jgi:hypothetical protein
VESSGSVILIVRHSLSMSVMQINFLADMVY